MSSTHSSRLSNSWGATHYPAVRKLVVERVGREWCLFLDRDGVMNRQVVGDYVRTWRDFEWLPRVPLALKMLREWAPRVVVVTNQQGIGKGLMSAGDVEAIHRSLRAELAADNVLIDEFQVCPHLEALGCACRKPKPALVLDWLKQHSDLEPSLSIMVGDSECDLELANNVAAVSGGCSSVQIGRGTDQDAVADASFDTLWDFAVAVKQARKEEGA
ncbi:MAG: D-glycero-alpha-D-manno-heptose-1,7-bisphosphate 7-phosphatase [Mycolicibacterium sp.]|uniref:D-glycero-alpha-D-manno-heptose-1,7-bisphosphate 7-phosphatase n=1 Tax=Mycolicibacterium sp. TaxID=2320850 RepID=UPI003D0F9108